MMAPSTRFGSADVKPEDRQGYAGENGR